MKRAYKLRILQRWMLCILFWFLIGFVHVRVSWDMWFVVCCCNTVGQMVVVVLSLTRQGFAEEFVAHTSNVNCLKIGKKSSRVLVTGGEDHKVNMWAIGKPNAILVRQLPLFHVPVWISIVRFQSIVLRFKSCHPIQWPIGGTSALFYLYLETGDVCICQKTSRTQALEEVGFLYTAALLAGSRGCQKSWLWTAAFMLLQGGLSFPTRSKSRVWYGDLRFRRPSLSYEWLIWGSGPRFVSIP